MENRNIALLITGADGWIGRNLAVHLRSEGWNNLLLYDSGMPEELLAEYAAEAGFVFHLEGVKSRDAARGLTGQLLSLLENAGNTVPVLAVFFEQADSAEAENLIFSHERRTGAPALVYRLPFVFGDGQCLPRPCSAKGLLHLVPVGDVMRAFTDALEGRAARDRSLPGYCHLMCDVCTVPSGSLAEFLHSSL